MYRMPNFSITRWDACCAGLLMTSSFDMDGGVKHPCHVTRTPSDPTHRPVRNPRSRLLWPVLLTLAASAVMINAISHSVQLGALIPIFVAVSIAMFSGDRPGLCGRRHAK
jgi:hypothetical protein